MLTRPQDEEETEDLAEADLTMVLIHSMVVLVVPTDLTAQLAPDIRMAVLVKEPLRVHLVSLMESYLHPVAKEALTTTDLPEVNSVAEVVEATPEVAHAMEALWG